MQRREFMTFSIKGIAGLALLSALRPFAASATVAPAEAASLPDDVHPLTLTDAEWKQKLPAAQYRILRKEGTEPAFTSALLKEHRDGTFACAGCGLSLFPSRFKFESGTGWPSFFDAIPGHVQTKKDYLLLIPRTEYHCARCGGHHGHVFNDGPEPTGLRYCNNGAVLTFTPRG